MMESVPESVDYEKNNKACHNDFRLLFPDDQPCFHGTGPVSQSAYKRRLVRIPGGTLPGDVEFGRQHRFHW